MTARTGSPRAEHKEQILMTLRSDRISQDCVPASMFPKGQRNSLGRGSSRTVATRNVDSNRI